MPPRLRPLARAVLEDAVEHVERLAHLLRVRVRPEVDDAAPVALAREHHARVLVLDRDRDVRERLVVAQADVERRPVALDQVLLDVERLRLGAGDDHLDVGDAAGQRCDLRARVGRRAGSTSARGPQRLRLADVEDTRRRRRGRGRRPASPGGASAAPRPVRDMSPRSGYRGGVSGPACRGRRCRGADHARARGAGARRAVAGRRRGRGRRQGALARRRRRRSSTCSSSPA